MQKDNPGTPKRRGAVKKHQAPMSEVLNRTTVESTSNIRAGMSRHRSTMAPFDFATPQIATRRVPVDRISMAPTKAAVEGDADCSDIELMLLYDEYLQNIMTDIILKKKVEDMEKLYVSQLAAMAKERERNEEKLFKLKTRERDIINLTKAQNEIDAQIMDANKYTKNTDIKELESILSQLHSLLECLDTLHCNNIVLPETREEWEETTEALKLCNDTLKSIMDLIGTKNESYQSVNDGIKDFLNTYNDIEGHHKRLEKELCDLQALVLEATSLSLTECPD
ncbi:uncharacterized protein LOC143369255 [Andrena cerasifolii]|uniref:uncharacterized protein LOC143369255 n=1 Tax=Andrena cerasifolii TaxID=2819439 RepID=UPI00403763B3